METTLFIHRCNPNRGNGGVEKYIRNQIEALNRKNVTCILLFPVRKNKIFYFNYLGLMINKDFKGVFYHKSILDWLKKVQENNLLNTILIHHLSNFDLTVMSKILYSLNFEKALFYIHDYYSACPQYNLLKNGKQYCGNAIITEKKCSSCKFYSTAIKHHRDMLNLFHYINKKHLEIIAPSDFTADLWGHAFSTYKDNIKVVPHLVLKGKYVDNKQQIALGCPIKVGFVGNQASNKGWNKWVLASEQIHQAFLPVELYYIGSDKDHRPYVKNIEASIEKSGNNAMMNALRHCKLDCAVLFSNCPETYSYTYFEAFAANCFVITNIDSGNIAFQVNKNRNGVILNNSAQDIFHFFEDTANLYEKINQFKKSNIYGPKILEDNFYNFDLINSIEIENAFKMPHKKISINRLFAEFAYRLKYHLFI